MDKRIYRYFVGDMTSIERESFLNDVFNDSKLKRDMMAYQNLNSLYELSNQRKDECQGTYSLKNFMNRMYSKKMRLVAMKALRYAAILIVGVFSTWFFMTNITEQKYAAVSQVMTVPEGQRAHITLPDGSKVWVNAGSCIKYPSVFGKVRHVELTGEALFDVKKDAKRPFIVSTKKADIKVLGTKFNVCSYIGESIVVSLLRGKVSVYKPEEESNATILMPNQQLTEINGKFSVSPITEDPILWKDGIYSFHNMKMNSIIQKLQLYYDIKICVKDKSLLNLEYSGKFRQRDGVVEMLRLIQKVHTFKMSKNEEKNEIIIYK